MEKAKRCTICKQQKLLIKFNKNKKTLDGRTSECKECHNKNVREYRSKPIYKKKEKEYNKNPRNKRRIASWRKAKHKKLKREVMNAYGGKCECCDENRIEFLSIEHSFGDGRKHETRVGCGVYVYLDLKKEIFQKMSELSLVL